MSRFTLVAGIFFRLDVREIAIVYKPPQSPRYSPPATYPAPSLFSLYRCLYFFAVLPRLCVRDRA